MFNLSKIEPIKSLELLVFNGTSCKLNGSNIGRSLFTAFGGCQQMQAQSMGGTLGFSCSIAGRPSMTVSRTAQLIANSQIGEIRTLLFTGNSAERYLATLSWEQLVNGAKLSMARQKRTKGNPRTDSSRVFSVLGPYLFWECSHARPVVHTERLSIG